MKDINRAIADIDAIRGQIARSTEFRGYGSAAHLFAAGLAVVAASFQARWLPVPESHVEAYLLLWVATAALALGAIGVEAVARATREHRGLARSMLNSAFEHFVPSLVAGVLLTAVLYWCAPQSLWMLPGLWQLFFCLGAFATCRVLPRPMFAVGLWYLSAGLCCLALGQGTHSLSPWLMGVPFGVGQLSVAAVLHLNERKSNG